MGPALLLISLLVLLARPHAGVAQGVATYTLPRTAVATALTNGGDGNLWFTYRIEDATMARGGLIGRGEFGVGRIAADGTGLTLFVLVPFTPTGTVQIDNPDSIVAGNNGRIYAVQNTSRLISLGGGPPIWAVTADGTGSEFWMIDQPSLGGLAVDSFNRVLWYTGSARCGFSGGVGVLSIGNCPPLSCLFFRDAEDPFPVGAQPGYLALSRDMNAWYTDLGNARIVRVTAGSLRFDWVEVPELRRPFDIVAGPDGNMWFTEGVFGRVGRVTPTFQLTEFPVPTRADRIAVGPDQVLYYTVFDRAVLGRITTDGSVTEFPMPQPLTFISGGPVAKVWASDALGNLYRFEPPPPCPGDCNRGLSVTVDEVVTISNLAVSGMPSDSCPLADTDGNNRITVEELVQATNKAVGGCP
jgi:streptogramin lyase